MNKQREFQKYINGCKKSSYNEQEPSCYKFKCMYIVRNKTQVGSTNRREKLQKNLVYFALFQRSNSVCFNLVSVLLLVFDVQQHNNILPNLPLNKLAPKIIHLYIVKKLIQNYLQKFYDQRTSYQMTKLTAAQAKIYLQCHQLRCLCQHQSYKEITSYIVMLEKFLRENQKPATNYYQNIFFLCNHTKK
eukprot:TRINITY_DN19669_c0_g1_i3.p2 TRINITY_DN19669_c0_g1~~TRINITY_DN19669_c0_g1_i3.p2  ORF type:complete len:189 (-),score=-13.21 TRINITY_DN19669_c0_g1_i3:1349-1915(-)